MPVTISFVKACELRMRAVSDLYDKFNNTGHADQFISGPEQACFRFLRIFHILSCFKHEMAQCMHTYFIISSNEIYVQIRTLIQCLIIKDYSDTQKTIMQTKNVKKNGQKSNYLYSLYIRSYFNIDL